MGYPSKQINKIEKGCLKCSKVFVSYVCSKRKFCSYQCSASVTNNRKGTKTREEGLKRMSQASLMRFKNESDHPRWKGEKVSYRTLHKWVQKWLGKPNKCSECGKIGYGHQMHWANASGEYKRETSDWLRLCCKCHGVYDKEHGHRVRIKI